MMDGHMPAGFEMLALFKNKTLAGSIKIATKGINPLFTSISTPYVNTVRIPVIHGIFTPIGAEQAAQTGKSIMYMLEANPGPGLGVLLAYWLFAKELHKYSLKLEQQSQLDSSKYMENKFHEFHLRNG